MQSLRSERKSLDQGTKREGLKWTVAKDLST